MDHRFAHFHFGFCSMQDTVLVVNSCICVIFWTAIDPREYEEHMMAMHSAKRQSVIHVPESVCSLHVYKSKVIVLEYDTITGGPIGSSDGVTLVYRLCTELRT